MKVGYGRCGLCLDRLGPALFTAVSLNRTLNTCAAVNDQKAKAMLV